MPASISTPDNMHAVATLAAMQLGKHVYTQKPLPMIFMKPGYYTGGKKI